jgi:hypothetical protein
VAAPALVKAVFRLRDARGPIGHQRGEGLVTS